MKFPLHIFYAQAVTRFLCRKQVRQLELQTRPFFPLAPLHLSSITSFTFHLCLARAFSPTNSSFSISTLPMHIDSHMPKISVHEIRINSLLRLLLGMQTLKFVLCLFHETYSQFHILIPLTNSVASRCTHAGNFANETMLWQTIAITKRAPNEKHTDPAAWRTENFVRTKKTSDELHRKTKEPYFWMNTNKHTKMPDPHFIYTWRLATTNDREYENWKTETTITKQQKNWQC